MDKYNVAYIDSADKYLSDLKLLGKNTNVTIKDLTLYMIILDLYNSADWNEWHELIKNITSKRK